MYLKHLYVHLKKVLQALIKHMHQKYVNLYLKINFDLYIWTKRIVLRNKDFPNGIVDSKKGDHCKSVIFPVKIHTFFHQKHH